MLASSIERRDPLVGQEFHHGRQRSVVGVIDHPAPSDEGRHLATAHPLWNESWYFDFHDAAGTFGGYVRLGLYPNLGVSWFWACVAGVESSAGVRA